MKNRILHNYVNTIVDNIENGLSKGRISVSDCSPLYLFRELEQPRNIYTTDITPLMIGYDQLIRTIQLNRTKTPRKIEYENAIFIHEGLVQTIFKDQNILLVIIGDSLSDIRLTINLIELFGLAGKSNTKDKDVVAFICNPSLIGKNADYEKGKKIKSGWNGYFSNEEKFYYANSWKEITEIEKYIDNKVTNEGKKAIALIDLDGSLIFPRPNANSNITNARKRALANYAEKYLDISDKESLEKISDLYLDTFLNINLSKYFDDADFTAAIAIARYFEIIDDSLLNIRHESGIGFDSIEEFIVFALYKFTYDIEYNYNHQKLYEMLSKILVKIVSGKACFFKEFRKEEHKILCSYADEDNYLINKTLVESIARLAENNVIPIAYSDRPNSSVGLVSNHDRLSTCSPLNDGLITREGRLIDPDNYTT